MGFLIGLAAFGLITRRSCETSQNKQVREGVRRRLRLLGSRTWLEVEFHPPEWVFFGPFFVLFEAKAGNVVTSLAPSGFSPKKPGAQAEIDPRITTGVFPSVPR